MEKELSIGKEKNLVDLVREIDPNFRLEKVLGRGGYGIVLKVTDGSKSYRLKVNKVKDIPERYDTLEREYAILEDLSKVEATPKPVKIYDHAPCAHNSAKGKNAYLTEFIDGEVLSKSKGELSEVSLIIELSDLIKRIHKAGYKFNEKSSDFNAGNILISTYKKLYLIDPMLLVPLREELPFCMTKEEAKRVKEIAERYG